MSADIIGGMFGLADADELCHNMPSFLTGRHMLLINARSGISLLIEQLSPHHIWMPSYLCGSMLEGITDETTSLQYYEVDYNLTVPSLTWTDDIQQGDIVLLIDYFGFPLNAACAQRAKGRGAWVLEDASQALLSEHVGYFSDFVLFSPRKFLGVPDGGVLVYTSQSLASPTTVELVAPPTAWWLKAFRAALLRKEYDLKAIPDRLWFTLFKETEAEFPVGRYAMSELSHALLQHSFDYPTIAQRRKDNYERLGALLRDVAIFPELPETVVPLGFPVRVDSRDDIRGALFNAQIYPPVHWPIAGFVPESFKGSHHLSNTILTLPCDQRYDTKDMDRMASLVRSLLDGRAPTWAAKAN